ncbi:AMP-binding protein [Amycolatopsis sp. NPDC004079]|uniref:class I adenylate-forming enzyme family protein n=1 Tax=Amycolatopsis sp. NPDC004079 TaxID=3154549 RepID=UPI00339DBE44
MQHDEVRSALTAPGAPFEMVEVEVRGLTLRAWRHSPPTLRAIVERMPVHARRTFLVHGGQRMAYGEAHKRIAGLAWALVRDQGIRKGDRVALAMRNMPEWPIAFLAAACAGAVVVPLNAWWERTELEFGLRDSGAKVLIADSERYSRLDGGLTVPTFVARPTGPLPEGAVDLSAVGTADGLPAVSLEPEDGATIFYTSGTTGTPKGAFGTHRNICTNVISIGYAAARSQLREGRSLAEIAAPAPPGVWLLGVPLFHVVGCHSVLLAAANAGGTLVLMRKWDPTVALELVERERITTFTGVPAMVAQLLAHPDFAEHDTASLTGLGTGGAAAPPVLAGRMHRRLPSTVPANGYGLTETSSMTTSNRGIDYLQRPDSVGQPVPVCELRIVDPSTGERLPNGEVGELRIRGVNVVAGYWNRPEATAAAITDGWLHSGDLARMDDDGFVYVVDRARDMLIRGGENIYCAEVESAIHEHPDVVAVAVIGIPDAMLGEQVGAVVQVGAGTALDTSALREFLCGRIAKFKIPAQVWVQETPLPRNAAGKIAKTVLRARQFPGA